MLVLFMIFFLSTRLLGDQDGDWQLWSSGSLQGNLGQRWKVSLEQQFRFDQSMNEFYYRYSDLGIVWRTTSWFEFGLYYAQLCQKSGDEWKQEMRPFIDGNMKYRWRQIQLSDRHRFERRLREDARNLWRYRNKLTITPASRWTKFRIQPYGSEESFVHLKPADLYRWRLAAGMKGEVIDDLAIDVHYLRQATEKERLWTHCNVLGFKLMFRF
jgi:hypothetical protein